MAMADAIYQGLTVGKLQADGTLRRRVETALANEGFELVMPPQVPRVGDQFLASGEAWKQVTPGTYRIAFDKDPSAFIVRRESEHRRMVKFFFGTKRI